MLQLKTKTGMGLVIYKSLLGPRIDFNYVSVNDAHVHPVRSFQQGPNFP